MVKKSRGFRTGTRRKLRMSKREKSTITKYLQKFKKGDKVAIVHEPSSHRGMPHPRFKGNIGIIVDNRGKGYIVEIKQGRLVKKIIAMPEHLKKLGD